jgi:hypothetical protein
MITRHHYEEYFLLYVDNELSPAERHSVETFVEENPDLLEELDALRQCKLVPEHEVSFGSLEPLLKEKDRRPFIIPFLFNRITRIAAAAILLLLIGLAIFRTTRPAAHNPAAPGKKDHELVTSAMPRTLYPKTTNTRQTMENTNKDIPLRKAAPDRTPVHAGDHAPTPDDPIPDDPITGDQIREQRLADTKSPVRQEIALIDPVNSRLPERIFVEQNAGQSTSYATLTARQETAAFPGDDFSEPAPVEKNRLRGILRKVSRVFERTANRDEDDRHPILIGNLQIALK